MASEVFSAREGSVNPINVVSRRTARFRTSTGYVNDAIIRRGVNLAIGYANTSPFSPSLTGPRNEQERNNRRRINNAVMNMLGNNRGRYF